jgi:hypothetical protein
VSDKNTPETNLKGIVLHLMAEELTQSANPVPQGDMLAAPGLPRHSEKTLGRTAVTLVTAKH